MAKQHDQQFKEEAVQYYLDHKDLGLRGCSENLDIGYSTLGKWLRNFRDNDGTVPTRGSGNYASDVEKENARLRKELHNAKDALDVLKKAISILGK
jgi:transposase